MIYQIESVQNGYVINVVDQYDDKVDTFVYESFVEVLRHLVEVEEPGSRHADKRIYVVEAPGDENENFSEKIADVIWGSE